MTVQAPVDARAIAQYCQDYTTLRRALGAAVVGQDGLIRDFLTALLAGGHVLLEGLPGLGKTQLARGMARILGYGLARIQCTPDLLPADITGSEMPADDGAPSTLSFRPGPIFASLVLVDEINRATPRTQSALLEAMQEGQVTCGGVAHPLPVPFWVLATQNPIELEGTYPLPEAQLDRFFFKCLVPSPDAAALARIVQVSLDEDPADRLQALFSPERIAEMLALPRSVVVAAAVVEAAVALVTATHPSQPGSSAAARAHVRFGASPRALQTLLRAARVGALADGRAHVSFDDLRAVALPALRHRILLTIESEIEGIDVDGVLTRIVDEWSTRL